MMAVREMDRFPGQWQVGIRDLRRRTVMAPTPRERERRQAIRLPAQGWTAAAPGRDPLTTGRWAPASGQGGPAALIFGPTGGSPRP